MTFDPIVLAAQALLDARRTGVHLDHWPAGLAPSTVDDGYRIQWAGHELAGERLGPWKVGATSVEAQRILGVDGPFTGRPAADRVFPTGSSLNMGELFVGTPAIEVEIGLIPTSDLSSVPNDPMELASIVEVAACLEFVDCRFASMTGLGVPTLIADNAVASAIVAGETSRLSAQEVLALDAAPVELEIDGIATVSGKGWMALGHPLNVLHFAATEALDQGTLIRSGELVITGTCTGIVTATPGITVSGRVGELAVTVGLEQSRGLEAREP